jgi:RecB family exonuclease
VEARPRQLSVTAVETLIRDPYAIYARHVLGLRPLDPLRQGPDPRLRGTVLHDVMEGFAREADRALEGDAAGRLRAAMAEALEARLPWPGQREIWLGKFDRMAPDFLAAERDRRAAGRPMVLEGEGRLELRDPPFVLTARGDRFDETEEGVALYDYKSGSLPSPRQQDFFAKQLLLEAWMVTEGAFPALGRRPVAAAAYLKVGSAYEVRDVPVGDDAIAEVAAGLRELLGRYAHPATGYVARLAPEFVTYEGAYDHLARLGEWDDTRPARAEPVGADAP